MTAANRFVEVHIGDEVRLRKPHPCGGTDWTVVRLGADIGLTCHTCTHRILLPRSQFERRLKIILSSTTSSDTSLGGPRPPIEPAEPQPETQTG